MHVHGDGNHAGDTGEACSSGLGEQAGPWVREQAWQA